MGARSVSLLTLALLLAMPLAGQGRSGLAHIYDSRGYAIACPAPYARTGYLSFPALSAGALDYPQDVAVGRNGHLLISDQGNARVMEIDVEGALIRTYRAPGMNRPGGLFWDARNGSLYVTDSDSAAIFQFGADGSFRKAFPPPRSDVLPEGYLYSPTRVVVDARGWLSIIGTGSSGGIIQLDGEGTFRGFFGANPASASLLRRLARLVASPEQKKAQRIQVLQPYTDLVLDADGFITTVTETLPSGQIRRLNALGSNTWPGSSFGEPVPVESEGGTRLDAAHLAYVATDVNGIVTVADRLTLRIFQYGPDGELLFAWGGRGDLAGTFQSISDIAVDRSSGALYVLDGVANAMHRFLPTEFARLVYRGARLYAEGRYEDALGVWLAVRERDANYPLANKGIAKVLLRLGSGLGRADYLAAAMTRSREAGDRRGFSDAFAAHRGLWVQRSMPWLVLAVAAFFVLAVASPRLRGTSRHGADPSPWRIWRVLGHPFLVMDQIKWSWQPSFTGASLLVLALSFGARVFQLAATSYHFTTWDPGRISLAGEAARMFLPWLTWVAANSLVTAIFAGEGKLRQIFCAGAFAMVPYAAITVLQTLLSHVLSLDEPGLAAALQALMISWTIVLFLLGATKVHGYSLRAALGTSALSLAGIAVLWGVGVLVLGLVSTFGGFIVDVVREVTLRG